MTYILSRTLLSTFALAGAFVAIACSSSSTPAAPTDGGTGGTDGTAPNEASSGVTVTGFQIVTAAGPVTSAVAGDALVLQVKQTMSDGTTQALPSGATVTWSGPPTIAALDPDSTANSPIPATGAQPTAFFLTNAERADRAADLAGVLFIVDPGTAPNGTVAVTATVAGVPYAGKATASITVGAAPTGDATRGATLYGTAGAKCGGCHGSTGSGSPPMASDAGADAAPDAAPEFQIEGATYDYPAPGLNAASSDNLAGDPDWTPALFAMAARSDMDNGGLALRVPMPDWLATPNLATGKPLSTQDLVDIYAYLKTQTQ